MTNDMNDERDARLFAADCAEQVLGIFATARPGDDRPRRAIEAARAFANHEIEPAALERALLAARAAAWSATADVAGSGADSPARAAADAAALAARAAAWAANRDAHMAAVGAARDAAEARQLMPEANEAKGDRPPCGVLEGGQQCTAAATVVPLVFGEQPTCQRHSGAAEYTDGRRVAGWEVRGRS